jgi:hypothetical protein
MQFQKIFKKEEQALYIVQLDEQNELLKKQIEQLTKK